jgi:hypothetical protein
MINILQIGSYARQRQAEEGHLKAMDVESDEFSGLRVNFPRRRKRCTYRNCLFASKRMQGKRCGKNYCRFVTYKCDSLLGDGTGMGFFLPIGVPALRRYPQLPPIQTPITRGPLWFLINLDDSWYRTEGEGEGGKVEEGMSMIYWNFSRPGQFCSTEHWMSLEEGGSQSFRWLQAGRP